MRPVLPLAPLALVALVGCSGLQVHHDYDLRTDFARYRTYDWKSARKAREGADALGARRVMFQVDQTLAAKGLKRETEGRPDLLLTFDSRWEKHRVRSTVSFGTGFGVGPLRVGARTQTGQGRTVKEGSLLLEMMDERSGEVVWTGEVEGVFLPGSGPEEAESRVAEAVKRLLEHFPPRKA